MLLDKLFESFPEGLLKNKMRCCFYNYFKKTNFHISYKDNCFYYEFENGVTFKSYEKIFYFLQDELNRYLMNYKIKKGDIIIDCGAYIGAFTLYAASVVGNAGIIIAFEPDPTNYKKLINNIKLNNLTNVIALNKGVWSKNTILKFNSKCSLGSSFFFNDNTESIIKVPVLSLDDELKKRGLKKVDFIKMDIEGAEIEAIKGAKETLKNNNVNLTVCSYHIVNGQKTCFELEKLFPKLGYKAKTLFPEESVTYASKNNF